MRVEEGQPDEPGKEATVRTLAAAVTAAMLSTAALGAKAPKPRSRGEVEAVLAKAPKPPGDEKLRKLDIVLLADVKDHGPGQHDYPCWQKRWALLLGGKKAAQPGVTQVNLHGPPAPGKPEETLARRPTSSRCSATARAASRAPGATSGSRPSRPTFSAAGASWPSIPPRIRSASWRRSRASPRSRGLGSIGRSAGAMATSR